MYFNPRPPRGGRRYGYGIAEDMGLISIHVPRVGDDGTPAGLEWIWGYFNPRPPRGGRPIGRLFSLMYCNFNPRPPRGGRHSF